MTDTREPTPVPGRTPAEERALLRRLLADPPPTLLVASDLHLGVGCDPVTGAVAGAENFLGDEAFAAFLEWHGDVAGAGGVVILNGDILDFLRITRVPVGPADLDEWAARLARLDEPDRARRVGTDIDRVERRYGLKTNPHKTLWKLMVIAAGHPGFFRALAGWLARGGGLVIAGGNHDPELYWPLVRRAIRDLLLERGAPLEAVTARVAFANRPFRVGNLFVEHGHQVEEMTRISGGPILRGAPDQINLPLGSFMNRYLINAIEGLDPLIDNITPVQDALLALLRKVPITLAGIYVRGWRFLYRVIAQMRRFNGSVAMVAALLFLPLLPVALLAAYWLVPPLHAAVARNWPWLQHAWAQVAALLSGAVVSALLPYLLGTLSELRERLRVHSPPDPWAAAAALRLRAAFPAGAGFARVYATMGHTHVQAAVRLDERGREALYLNTGTWIALWPHDRPDLAGRVRLSYARFDLERRTGEYRHQSLVWCDEAAAPRPANVLAPDQRRVL